MRKKGADFFTSQEKELIKQAVEKAESSTSGEIAVMVVDESDSYREAAVLGSFVSSGLLALLAEILYTVSVYYNQVWTHSTAWSFAQIFFEIKNHITVWMYIPILFVLYFPCAYFMKKLPGLKILFMSGRRIEEIVSERALRAFYEKGLYRTRDETGILIFISLLERRVWILGDRGINTRIPAGFWKDRSEELTGGIRKKSHGKAVVEIISQCGAELARHFPRKPDDTNELSDNVII